MGPVCGPTRQSKHGRSLTLPSTFRDVVCFSLSHPYVLNERIIQFADRNFAANDLINTTFENEQQTALYHPDDIVNPYYNNGE